MYLSGCILKIIVDRLNVTFTFVFKCCNDNL